MGDEKASDDGGKRRKYNGEKRENAVDDKEVERRKGNKRK